MVWVLHRNNVAIEDSLGGHWSVKSQLWDPSSQLIWRCLYLSSSDGCFGEDGEFGELGQLGGVAGLENLGHRIAVLVRPAARTRHRVALFVFVLLPLFAQTYPEFDVGSKDIVIVKTRYYAGSGNSLEDTLRSQSIETAILVSHLAHCL